MDYSVNIAIKECGGKKDIKREVEKLRRKHLFGQSMLIFWKELNLIGVIVEDKDCLDDDFELLSIINNETEDETLISYPPFSFFKNIEKRAEAIDNAMVLKIASAVGHKTEGQSINVDYYKQKSIKRNIKIGRAHV